MAGFLPILLFVTIACGTVSFAENDAPLPKATAYEKVVRPFLQQHCFECHDARKAKAGLRLDQLGTDFLVGKTADQWKEVIDAINLGEMPPEEMKRPDAKASFALVEWVGRELNQAEREARMAGGRVLIRRMNRSEYANTIRDLLHLDENFVELIKEELPGDGKAEGFDRIGSALLFDQTQLSTYIRLGDRIAKKAIVDSDTPPEVQKSRMEIEEEYRPRNREHEVIQYQKDTAIPPGPSTLFKRDGGLEFIQPIRYGGKGEFGHLGSTFNRVTNQDSVPRNGYYKLRIRAGAFEGDRGEPIRIQWTYAAKTPLQEQGEIVIKGTLDKPQVVETTMFLRKVPEGAKASKEEIDAAKAKVEQRIAEARKWSKTPGAVAKIWNPKRDRTRTPRLFVDWMEFEGPIEREWPPKSHRSLLPNGMVENDAKVRDVFARLLPRAYRRPVTDTEVQEIVDAVKSASTKFGMSQVDAMRYGLQTVLTMPQFLMIVEPSKPGDAPRKLNDHELASRLSYYLWSTMPDDELFGLASKGKLRDPTVLREQVTRMLADDKAHAFVENFTGQWLHVREFGITEPARDYKDYDDALRDASIEEPYAFFQHVLRNDRPILDFLDSDYAVINERLATFYGIQGVEGDLFRKVALQPGHHRGGVLTMAGLMQYLSDGTRTLPVRRGAWILEQMFNDPPPPPPPNAGEIQPNAKGKNLTVRERLELHRNEPTCASCHAKIDPLGLALENYDAIGAWRTKQNGEGFRSHNAPPIDASGTLPSGRAFSGPAEFKQALLAEKDRFARAFTEKMLTYALGRPIGYVDHKTVDTIVGELKRNDYRIQAMVQAIVASEPFLTK